MRDPCPIALWMFNAVLLFALALTGGCAQFSRPADGGAELARSPITDNPSGEIYPGRMSKRPPDRG